MRGSLIVWETIRKSLVPGCMGGCWTGVGSVMGDVNRRAALKRDYVYRYALVVVEEEEEEERGE